MAGDSTIPKHGARRPTGFTTYGWFVDYGSTVVLTDRWGNTWSLDSVSIAQGSFGWAEEGVERLPRPRKYDATGALVIQGDTVVIDFVDGNPKLPIVRGGLRAARHSDFLAKDHRERSAPYNRCAARMLALDASGNTIGEARLLVHDDGDAGGAELSATSRFRIFVGPDLDGAAGVTLTVEGGTVTIEAGGLTEPVILGASTLADLSAGLLEVQVFLAALGIPTVNLTAFITQAQASLVTNAPYLSKVTFTE